MNDNTPVAKIPSSEIKKIDEQLKKTGYATDRPSPEAIVKYLDKKHEQKVSALDNAL